MEGAPAFMPSPPEEGGGTAGGAFAAATRSRSPSLLLLVGEYCRQCHLGLRQRWRIQTSNRGLQKLGSQKSSGVGSGTRQIACIGPAARPERKSIEGNERSLVIGIDGHVVFLPTSAPQFFPTRLPQTMQTGRSHASTIRHRNSVAPDTMPRRTTTAVVSNTGLHSALSLHMPASLLLVAMSTAAVRQQARAQPQVSVAAPENLSRTPLFDSIAAQA